MLHVSKGLLTLSEKTVN